jgi:NAD-specific glutamate dehydrogenase
MILNLNAEQFLLIYNKLLTDPAQSAHDLKNKMDILLLDLLSSMEDAKNQAKFSSWIKQEQDRISSLKSELKVINENISDDGLHYPFVKDVK